MRKQVKQLVSALGLGGPAQAAWMAMKARGLTPWQPLVPEQEFRACVAGAVRRLRDGADGHLSGLYLEFGVSRGTSLACVHNVLREAGVEDVRLIGFDSFEGMPAGSETEGWQQGDFRSSLSATRRYLAGKGMDMKRVDLVQGWFADTLTPETRERLGLSTASLIMVDCDIYTASKEALEFCLPCIGDQAVIMFDDWGEAERMGKVGQKEAFNEFLEANPGLKASELPGYNASSRVFHVRRECQATQAAQAKVPAGLTALVTGVAVSGEALARVSDALLLA